MYCGHCGKVWPEEAGTCPACGAASGMYHNYCELCGAALDEGAAFCPRCAVVFSDESLSARPLKSRLAAGLLGIFLGGFGAHSFYLGFRSKGILQIVLTVLTAGLASIWGVVEGLLILLGVNGTDSDGRPLV